jgi:hypothetical protein
MITEVLILAIVVISMIIAFLFIRSKKNLEVDYWIHNETGYVYSGPSREQIGKLETVICRKCGSKVSVSLNKRQFEKNFTLFK